MHWRSAGCLPKLLRQEHFPEMISRSTHSLATYAEAPRAIHKDREPNTTQLKAMPRPRHEFCKDHDPRSTKNGFLARDAETHMPSPSSRGLAGTSLSRPNIAASPPAPVTRARMGEQDSGGMPSNNIDRSSPHGAPTAIRNTNAKPPNEFTTLTQTPERVYSVIANPKSNLRR